MPVDLFRNQRQRLFEKIKLLISKFLFFSIMRHKKPITIPIIPQHLRQHLRITTSIELPADILAFGRPLLMKLYYRMQ